MAGITMVSLFGRKKVSINGLAGVAAFDGRRATRLSSQGKRKSLLLCC